MTIIVSSKRGESRAEALKRAKAKFSDRSLIYEGGEGENANVGEYPTLAGDIMNEYSVDKMKVLKAIGMMRVPWGNKVKLAINNCNIAKNINKEMVSPGGLARYISPTRLMMTAEAKLGHVFSINDKKQWIIEKYYSVVSNLDNSDWNRGSTAGATYTDDVYIGPTTDITYVNVDRSSFCETRRLGISAGEVMAQDMAEADRLAKAMKFPKLREGLSPNQRRAISDVMKMANNGQNHLTRLVRGVLLSIGADLSHTGKILLKSDKNKYTWDDYVPSTIEAVHGNPKSCAIWCSYPSRQDYASIIVHFTQAWCCEGMPLRVNSIRIPSDAEYTHVVSLGAGEIHDVDADGALIRGALTSYAQSMGCEDILEQAYCIGSMLLLHEYWPAVHLPASLWASDLIRPAMATKHEISRHKREWKLRECLVVAKYAADVLGLMIKELMSSGWEHNTEKLEDVVNRISRGQKVRRDEMYRWVIENITGEGSGYIFNLDPLKDVDIQRVKRVNDTSILKYWWIGEVKGVGGDSLCSALLCSDYTTIPSTGTDTATAREIGFLRQLGVITNGPMYKREVRLKKVNVDKDKKDIIDGCIKEGRVSVVPSGISTHIHYNRKKPKLEEWKMEPEESDQVKYDDDDDVTDVDNIVYDDDDDYEPEDIEGQYWGDLEKDDDEKKKDEREKREKDKEERDKKVREEERNAEVRSKDSSKAQEKETSQEQDKEKEGGKKKEQNRDKEEKKRNESSSAPVEKESGSGNKEKGEEREREKEKEKEKEKGKEKEKEKDKEKEKEKEEKEKEPEDESDPEIEEVIDTSGIPFRDYEAEKKKIEDEEREREKKDKEAEKSTTMSLLSRFGASLSKKKADEIQSKILEDAASEKVREEERERAEKEKERMEKREREKRIQKEALYESDEMARASDYWKSVTEEWVSESEFLLSAWRKKQIGKNIVERCCGLKREIFPVSSIHFDGLVRGKDEIVKASGMLIAMLEMGNEKQGKWDINYVILQAWGWKRYNRWYDSELCKMMVDVIKSIFGNRKMITPVENTIYDIWSKGEFGCKIDVLVGKKKEAIDESIKLKRESKLIMNMCKVMGLKKPDWGMYDISEDGKEILLLLDLPIPSRRFVAEKVWKS